jgi:protein phosphatase 1 regulatory subunit 7
MFFILGNIDIRFHQMSNNQIPDLHSLVDQIGSILTLETLYLEGNPCQLGDESYRRKVKLYLPRLKQIDATYVGFSFSLFVLALLNGVSSP